MKKLSILFVLLALAFAGVFVFDQTAWANVAPWNVNVQVCHDGVVVSYNLSERILPQDDADSHAYYGSAKIKAVRCRQLLELGLPQDAVFEYLLPGFSDIIKTFDFVCVQKVDSTVTFGKKGFTYTEGVDGKEVDKSALFYAMINASGGQKIALPIATHKSVTVSELKRNTAIKGKFTTSFASSGQNRRHNVKRAADSLNGITVQPGKQFSFNQVVGERTVENGYKTAKVISDGFYTDGVGGGVCQVSTTLYNALLLADVIPKCHAHSLVPSYVMAGFDAMVSYGSADMTFQNTTDFPLYISASAEEGKLTFCVYGQPNGYQIKRENNEVRQPFSVTEIVDEKKFPDLVYTDQIAVVRGGSDGVKSTSYLAYYNGGKLVCRKKIRTDNYKKVDKIIARGATLR